MVQDFVHPQYDLCTDVRPICDAKRIPSKARGMTHVGIAVFGRLSSFAWQLRAQAVLHGGDSVTSSWWEQHQMHLSSPSQILLGGGRAEPNTRRFRS